MKATTKGVISFRLSGEQTTALRAAASEDGLSLSDMLRAIIDEYIECLFTDQGKRRERIEHKSS